jgi:hypothetical protein
MKQITHLDIRCDRLLDESWTGFKELTSLKYFRMVDDYGGHEEIHSAVRLFSENVPPNLVLCVVHIADDGYNASNYFDLAAGLVHPLVVLAECIHQWYIDNEGLEWLIQTGENFDVVDTLFGNELEEGWLWKEGERIIRKRKAELAAGSWYGSLPGLIGGRMVQDITATETTEL